MSFNFQHYFILLTFLLRKVNHTLGDHRSGRAWNRNRPNEITADNCKKNCITKISKERKKEMYIYINIFFPLLTKKSEKFSPINLQKKIETFSLNTLVSALSELQGNMCFMFFLQLHISYFSNS